MRHLLQHRCYAAESQTNGDASLVTAAGLARRCGWFAQQAGICTTLIILSLATI